MDSIYEGWIAPFYDRLESIPGLMSSDIAVYFAMLAIAQAAGGASRGFSASIRTLESKSRVPRSTLYKSINRLQQYNLIQYRKGAGSASPKFTLCLPGGHCPRHYAGHYPRHYAGHIDDIHEEDDRDIYITRAREAWQKAFGVRPEGALAEAVDYWAFEWDVDLLVEAFNAAALAGAGNKFAYVNKTLADWRTRGIKTVQDWARMQVAYDGM